MEGGTVETAEGEAGPALRLEAMEDGYSLCGGMGRRGRDRAKAGVEVRGRATNSPDRVRRWAW